MLQRIVPSIVIVFASATIASGKEAWNEHEALTSWNIRNEGWESPAIERDRLVTDRPHVSEATELVGLGTIQLETGYTFFSDATNGLQNQTHSFPEPLLRWGILAEWFELRLGYNYLIDTTDFRGRRVQTLRDSDDMLLAAKVAIVKQNGVLPSVTIFPQFRLPTGGPSFSADLVLPGANIAYSWVVSPLLEIECNSVFNQKRDGLDHYYVEYLQTLNLEFDLGDRWMGFTEFLAFVPSSSLATLPEYYFHTGIQYYLTPNIQFDVHSAVGLNRAATNLAFTGAGLSVRY